MLHVFTHEECLAHQPGPQHPECPARLDVILAALRNSPLAIDWRQAPLGTKAQVELAHTATHWQQVCAAAPETGLRSLDPDTHLSPGSLRAVLRGVGGACAVVDLLRALERAHAFCLTRPPGHHATPDSAMGFCVFNQAAIAALHAQRQHGVQRVAVVDFDVHHGNGTQDILAGRPGLLYVSTHQFPHYPGTGSGSENRLGKLHNVPLAKGLDDESYRRLFSQEVLPVLAAFRPELLVVSAGFDAHARDPLGGLQLTEPTYGWLGQQLGRIACEHAHGRLLSVLEGGYNLQVLGSSVVAYASGVEEIMTTSTV